MGRRGRPREEPSKSKSFRLPIRLWNLLEEAALKDYRSVNMQLRMLIEDYLVSRGLMEDEDRRRPTKPKSD